MKNNFKNQTIKNCEDPSIARPPSGIQDTEQPSKYIYKLTLVLIVILMVELFEKLYFHFFRNHPPFEELLDAFLTITISLPVIYLLLYRPLVRQIYIRTKTEEALRKITHGVLASTGKAFFCSLVKHLTKTLEMEYVFIGELTEDGEKVQTVAVCVNGKIEENFEYHLANTPCENVAGKELCCYPNSVQQQFPKDNLLVKMQVESYLGIPLFDSVHRPMGILVVLDKKPIIDPGFAQSMLQIFAVRVASEMERKRTEAVLRENAERLFKINETLLKFETDHIKNINSLTVLAGQLLHGTCALYNCLDKGLLCSTGQWNTPLNYNPVDKPEGHICYDVIRHSGDQVFIVRDLQKTLYAKTDRNVALYGLQTYVGQAVKCGEKYVGSLCVVYQKDFVPSEEQKKILGIIASAIGIEEERKRVKDAAKESYSLFNSVIEGMNNTIFVKDAQGRYMLINSAGAKFMGKTIEEVIGKDDTELFSVESGRKIIEKDSEIMATGKTETYEETVTAMGVKRTYFTTKGVYRNIQGDVIGIFGIANDITGQKQAEIVHKQFSKSLVESQEERKRIAAEIHDGIGQNILLIKNGIRKCLKSLSNDGIVEDTLNRISLIAQQSIDEVREIIANLHPHQLDQLGLKGAIESVLRQAIQSSEIKFLSEIQEIDGLLHKNNEIHLYRIIQEGISNVVKHSGASTSRIYMRKNRKFMNITIKDNGKGFVFNSDGLGESGFGLVGISERVKILEGNFEVDSIPGKGTTLTIKVPLKMGKN